MGMYDQFRSDEVAERDGIFLDYGDFRVQVARAGGANRAYRKELERATKPFRRAIQADAFSEERAEPLLMEVFAKTVVRGWEVKEAETGAWRPGIEAADGSVLPFTVENVLATFRALPDLYRDIVEQAGKGVLYRLSLREEAGKNS